MKVFNGKVTTEIVNGYFSILFALTRTRRDNYTLTTKSYTCYAEFKALFVKLSKFKTCFQTKPRPGIYNFFSKSKLFWSSFFMKNDTTRSVNFTQKYDTQKETSPMYHLIQFRQIFLASSLNCQKESSISTLGLYLKLPKYGISLLRSIISVRTFICPLKDDNSFKYK